jgi:methylenetetrahydrofolate reductase (NADPH)
MKITDLFVSQERTFSFEFFPPKDEISAVDFGINVGQLMRLSPSFVTVTYGAGGSDQGRTYNLVDYLQNKIGLTTVAHYTCVNATKEMVEADLKKLQLLNIENLMLLRGDPPKGAERFIAPVNGFKYASELISYVDSSFDFCKAAACYVEKHPEAFNFDEDIANLKTKVNSGADFLISQLFFDNRYYFSFVKRAHKAGINCRIIPGIIPITSFKQIEKFTKMSGTHIPPDLAAKLEKHKDNPSKTYQIGINFTIKQCRALLDGGAPGIHFYTLNKSRAAIEIFESL